MIDVRELIARYSIEEHMAKADAYFAGLDHHSSILRKPWQNVSEARELTRNMSIIFQEMQLRPGIRLLDFGAGTCWSSFIFAYLGCDVIAADVSNIALEQAARTKAADEVARDLPIRFMHIDSPRLPLDDAEVDRIVCIDCFHHVADQAATLAEFYRVLRPGGRIAFSEPGPDHSRSSQSQHEMRTYGVIENDIVIEEIDRVAQEIGFLPMRVAYHTPSAFIVDVETFNRWRIGKIHGAERAAIFKAVGAGLTGRNFFLWKTGDAELDSRGIEGLAGSIVVNLKRSDTGYAIECTVTNTGSATWLPSGGELGAVNLGIQVFSPEGFVIDQDFQRVGISDLPVAPGSAHELSFDVVPPLPECVLRFDLVSELVAWFGTHELSQPVSMAVSLEAHDFVSATASAPATRRSASLTAPFRALIRSLKRSLGSRSREG